MNTQHAAPHDAARPYRDIAFISVLLGLAAVPLLLLRHHPIFFSIVFQVTVWIAEMAVFAVWVLLDRRADLAPTTSEPRRWPGLLRNGGYIGALSAVTLIVFYVPMREHFWAGGDETHTLSPEVNHFWSDGFVTDKVARPTWGIGPMLGQLLTPDRIDGHLWLAATLMVSNALLLFAIIRCVLPSAPQIAAAAGLLLICHRGDTSRFFVMWTGNWYWTTLAFLLAGTLLLIHSARSNNRGMLVAACMALGTSLLGSEAGYPLATLGPVLLYLIDVRGRRLLVWSYAWYGTIALMATRYLLYLISGPENYQSSLTGGIREHPGALLANLKSVSLPFLTWFGGFRFLAPYCSGYWLAAGTALAAALASLGLLLTRQTSVIATNWRTYLVAIAFTVLAAAAGLAPFILIGNGSWRTQFYTAPGQAALIAIVLSGICGVFGRHCSAYVLAALVGLMAANSRVENLRFQANIDKHVNFIKSVRIFDQLRAVTPTLDPDTLVVLVTDDGMNPLGGNQYVNYLSNELIGYCHLMANSPDAINELEWEPTGVVVKRIIPPKGVVTRYPTERIVVFRVSGDGTLFLLRKLPEDVLSQRACGDHYNPLPLLHPGPIAPLRLMQYPSWVDPPQDVIDASAGLGFGKGWSDQETASGRVFRQAEPGAEMVINPQGEKQRSLHLELEAEQPSTGVACFLEMRDIAGRTLARMDLREGNNNLELTIPTDPRAVAVVSLWLCSRETGESIDSPLRVYAPRDTLLNPSDQDIVGSGVRVGKKWYPLEIWKGERFRWFNTGAELILPRANGKEFVIDMIGGAGLGGKPCQLRFVGPNDRILHQAEIDDRDRRAIRFRIPPDLGADAVVRLEVQGGGISTSVDPRIRNARVFHCEIRP